MTQPKPTLPHHNNGAKGNVLGVIHLVGAPESARTARDFVKQALGANHPALDAVVLLVSETITNAVIHSNSRDGGRVTLTLIDCNDLIHIDVADAGGTTIPHVRGGLLDEGGRGLMLVDAISQHWAVVEREEGRTLWFQVPCTPT
ncbi:ATP-binding protein [Sphaerisporangium sp. B11E5]|uniref:ATP-binding protein n=1 Tax=Sphaerisporangium sp. B11E5 TaxID=3153563 RepID=UPI00325D6601